MPDYVRKNSPRSHYAMHKTQVHQTGLFVSHVTINVITTLWFDQCAAVLRCVGIPTRTVTIFLSAHDSNHDMAMDFFYDKDNMPIFHLGSEMDW